MGLLTRDKPEPAEGLPDLSAFSEEQLRRAADRHMWKIICRGVLDRLADDRRKRLEVTADPEARAEIERYFDRMAEPYRAEDPPKPLPAEAFRRGTTERLIDAGMVTPADLKLRELEDRTGQKYRYLAPNDGQPRPPGFGPDEEVYLRVDEEEDGDD
jgi:hypothetical protein